jgi:tRNA-dependent cyclodipeptide synthase
MLFSMEAHGVNIKGIKGVELSEITEKKHNIWIGISLSNKIFTRENIKSLIQFALENTREKVLVWIPGRMHTTNYYIDRVSRADALKRAFQDEDRCKELVAEILSEFPSEERNKVVISNYEDTCTPKHIKQKGVLLREFSNKDQFYDDVLEIVAEIIKSRGRTYNKERAESLSLYVISELPMFVDGVQANGDPTTYTVIPYPGFGKVDELEMAIVKGEKYPELTKKLDLSNKVGIIDVEFS